MILESLLISSNDVVSIVGSGGKTTLMFTLARELVAQGNRVITTTTTKIFPPGPEDSPTIITTEDQEQVIANVREELKKVRHVTIGLRVEDPKLKGIDPDLINDMKRQQLADIILVEADGSRQCPLKAPNETEPVIPASTTVVIAVVGLDGIGKPNTDGHVFRPDYFARMGGIGVGDPVTPESVVRVLFHRESLLRDVPKGARTLIVLNKADSQQRLAVGSSIAHIIMEQGLRSSASVLVTRMVPTPEVLRGFSSVGDGHEKVLQDTSEAVVSAIILAAGESRRMGTPKLLLPWKQSTIIEQVVDTLMNSGVAEVIVVGGAETPRIRNLLRGRPVTVVENKEFRKGMSASIQCGIDAASKKTDAYLIALADQPLITTEIVNRVITSYVNEKTLIAVAAHAGQRGHPVVFDTALRQELCSLQGDEGGRSILKRYADKVQYVEVGSNAIFADIDFPEDYSKMRDG